MNPITDQQLDEIEAKAAELRQKIDRKNPWPSDNESHWTAEGWKAGTRNALDKLHVEQLVAEVRRLRAKLADEERLHGDTIDDRDHFHEMSDKLAYAVAPIEVIGEHSSMNCPWDNALDLITPMAEVDKLRRQLAEAQRERDLAVAHDRQPYPTAWAYEQACKALNRKTEAVDQVRAMHKPRTERHGSGCVQCGIVWPCPTYNALNEAVRPAVETGA